MIKFSHSKTKNGEISEKYGDKVAKELDHKLAKLKVSNPNIQPIDKEKILHGSVLEEIFKEEKILQIIKESEMKSEL